MLISAQMGNLFLILKQFTESGLLLTAAAL